MTPDSLFVAGDGGIFRDDFVGRVLDDGWSFLGSEPVAGGDSRTQSLAERPGFLRIYPQALDADAEGGTPSGWLRLARGDFVLTTRMQFVSVADRQLAGLVVEGEDGRAVTLGLISVVFPRETFRGFTLLADRGPDEDPDTEFAVFEGTDVFLRLERAGDTFEGAFSEDGVTFVTVGTVSTDLSNSVRVGLGTILRDNCVQDCDRFVPADFDFFQIVFQTIDRDG
ncbi:MAG: hypothetical protein IID35_04315 [Planctomycetes bacterium]|nr:hypothetical protein [Planctomycetota bacterium]